MELVVISSPREEPNEVEEVVRMFDMGLKHFHIRKPRMSKRELADYIRRYPDKFRKQMIIHTYHALADQFKLGGVHLSRSHRKRNWVYHFSLWVKRRTYPDMVITRTFHKLTDITSDKRKYTYAFLSPIFDSVSRSSLSGGFSKRALLIMIPQAKQPIYALGGISPDKLSIAAENGFQGAAFHGSIWESEKPPHIVFKEAQQEVKALKIAALEK